MKSFFHYLCYLLAICWLLSFNAQATNTTITTTPLTDSTQTTTQEHPLLDLSFPIQWSKITPEQSIIDINLGLEQANKDINAITQIPNEKLTFDNTFMEFERINNILDYAFGRIFTINALLKTDATSKAVEELQPKLNAFSTSLFINEALYKKFNTFAHSEARQKLTALQQRYIDQTLENFKNQGANLTPEQKKRLLEIATRLTQLNIEYSNNSKAARNAWELIITDPKQIEGLPELVADRLRLDALNRGHGSVEQPNWRLTLDYTTLSPEITYIQDPSIRKKIWLGATSLGTLEPYNNIPRIIEILKLRQEKAQLLGNKNFADWATRDLMMKNGTNALNFVENMHSKIHPLFDSQLQELGKMSQKSSDTMPNPWDINFLVNIKERETYGFDSEDYRPYLRLDDALKALFATDEKLYNIRIIEKPTYVANANTKAPEGAIEVWHPDVRFYEIYDNNNQHIASFYGDWIVRDSKQPGAWMLPLQEGTFNSDGTHTPHIIIINSDSTPPTANTPSLLALGELRTLFHEFGHLLHGAFGNIPIPSMNGTSVAKDFVEFPSQFNEALSVEPSILTTFARHYQTGEPLPQKMLDAASSLEYSYSGIMRMRQLYLCKIDLSLHMTTTEFTPESLNTFLEKNLEDYMPKYSFKIPFPIGSVDHLFGIYTYASVLYTYDWDNVLSLDVLERFKKEGLLNPELGLRFRNEILSRGDSEDPDVLYRNFMGREPSLNAALKAYGVPANN